MTQKEKDSIEESILMIENWKGDCYSTGDDVETALDGLRSLIGRERETDLAEWCDYATYYSLECAKGYYDLNDEQYTELSQLMEK